MFHVGWVDLEGHHRNCPTQLGLEPLPVFASPACCDSGWGILLTLLGIYSDLGACAVLC